MPRFANQAEFDAQASYQRAMGVDLNANHAIVSTSGQVLAYAQTGGMMAPRRHELMEGAKIYRFGAAGSQPQKVAYGSWWVEAEQFDKLIAFSNSHQLFVGMAVRLLCLVPPEWSDMGLLVRARVKRPLLAWRGLGNSVVTPRSGGGTVNLPHQNDIAARRLHQLFVPGLGVSGLDALIVEQSYPLDPAQGKQGWLYL